MVIIITVGSAGGILGVREFYFREDTEEIKVAEEGDTVEIHYVGRLWDERAYDGYRIFDTSYEDIPDVGEPSFTLTYDHERERGEPFQFTLGEDVIDGWNENIEGMEEGESQTFVVPPEKGYGEKNEDLIFENSKTETFPVFQRMDLEEFEMRHGMPQHGKVVEDHFWGWEKTVVSIDIHAERVTLRNDPDVGESYGPYIDEGWEAEVVSVNTSAAGGDGEISVEHDVSESLKVDAGLLANYRGEFGEVQNLQEEADQSPEGEGILIPDGDKMIFDFNEEVRGVDLVFEVEVIGVDK